MEYEKPIEKTSVVIEPNILTMLGFSSSDVEKDLRTYKLQFSSTRRNDMEWGIQTPSFIDTFYQLSVGLQKVPSQEEYWHYYLQEYSAWFTAQNFSPEQLEGLQARIYRTYPSLVRDLHFGKLLTETNVFKYVWYNTSLDQHCGIDLVVNYKDQDYAVNLYTDTARARESRLKKANRHEPLTIPSIEFPLTMNDTKKVGDYFLYTTQDAYALYEKVKVGG